MSIPQAFSLGVGIALRVIINTIAARNDKLAGALSGIWDGIVAYTAWTTDRLLEPPVLVEIIAGVCFDALYHGTPTRLVSLALGCVLGVLISDTTGLLSLWDDFGENVQETFKELDIKDDLDSPDVLTEFSEDATVIYEEERTERPPRTRKMSTAEWILAQRKARSSTTKSTSRRASQASINISTELDKSLLSSSSLGLDYRTQLTRTTRTDQTQSSRGRRDRELLASMTPLPVPSSPSAPSIATRSRKSTEINIDVLSPSVSTRISSPTIKTEIIENQSFRESNEGVAIDVSKPSTPPKSAAKSSDTRSDRTVKHEAIRVKAESINLPANQPPRPTSGADRVRPPEGHDIHPSPSQRSMRSIIKEIYQESPRSKRTTTDQSSFQPFIPPRPSPSLSRAPTVISAVHSQTRSPGFAPQASSYYAAADVPSFGPVTLDDDPRERLMRSRASTRRTERFEEGYVEPSVARTRERASTVRSKSSAHRASTSHVEEAQVYAQSILRSESRISDSGQIHTHTQTQSGNRTSASPAPEVIIDYSGDTTRIYIPPPAETGVNVRIVPRTEESQTQPQQGMRTGGDLLHVDHLSRSEDHHSHDILFPAHSIGSFPELDSVPPDPEQDQDQAGGGTDEAPRSHASRAEISSDPQPPSIFKLSTAWRNSGSVPPPSLSDGFGEQIVESDDPLPVYISENLAGPAEVYVPRSPSKSAAANSELPPSIRRRSRSAASRYSRTNGNTLDLDVRGEDDALPAQAEVITPSVEWFGPARAHRHSHSHSHSHAQSHRRRRSDASYNYDRHEREREHQHEEEVPIPIARSTGYRQSATFVSSPTIDESIASRRTKTTLLERAQELEVQAREMDARCKALQGQIEDAQKKGRNAFAFTLGCELEDAEDRARKLHRRAERAHKSAREVAGDADKIDVHHLSPLEAVQAVKNALHAVQRQGRSKLSVIVDKGRRAAESSSVRRSYIIDNVTKKYHFDVKTDEVNPNVLHITIPSYS